MLDHIHSDVWLLCDQLASRTHEICLEKKYGLHFDDNNCV